MELEDISNNKDQVRDSLLFIELAALLHDIGKLSKVFLEYRMKWQSMANGYNVDPHEKIFTGPYDFDPSGPYEKFNIPDTFDLPADSIRSVWDIDGFTIKKAVRYHDENADNLVLKFIKAADGIDSAQDRNNPLWGAEQKNGIFKSNVFGFEDGQEIIDKQDASREKLYTDLKELLPIYLNTFDASQREKTLDAIKTAFAQGLSDTTRPQNDTTLWEHCYSVATITKAIAARYLLTSDPMDEFAKVKFGILGAGWDGVSFLSSGDKIGDVLGRGKVIADIRKALKELIEYKYCLGNSIYEDDDGIYFLIPANLSDGDLDTLTSEINKVVSTESSNEIQPHIYYSKETNVLTHIVKTINHVKTGSSFRFIGSMAHVKFPDGKQLCPVCRLKPIENKNMRACRRCVDRRTKFDPESGGTPFIQEICDKGTRRAALIVARFGLDEWLNGSMVRTLFVTEANGIRNEITNLGIAVEQFKTEEAEHKKFFENHAAKYGEFNFGRIKADIDSIVFDTDSARAEKVQFLYSRRIFQDNNKWVLAGPNEKIRERWESARTQAQKETPDIDIYNMLCAKTPTPSTVLDVWESTKNFLEKLPESFLLEPRKRLGLVIKPAERLSGAIEAEAELPGGKKKIEFIFPGDRTDYIEVLNESADNFEKWAGVEIKVIDKEYADKNITLTALSGKSGAQYLPFRTITASPNLFLAIVPADKAVEITRNIYKKYVCHFGKVMGRLPFSIGNIFFREKMPMFIGLDAAMRMLSNFDRLHSCGLEFNVREANYNTNSAAITFEAPERLPLKWNLSFKLGNNEGDYHHPYFIIPKREQLAKTRSTYFEVPAGAAVHFSQVEPGDVLRIYPNYYDFEFLDSNTRRHDIHLDSNKKRRSSIANFKSRPYLLEELDQQISFIWDTLLRRKGLIGITDAKLRNLQSLWLTKYQEWVEPDHTNLDLWKEFIRSSIEKEFPQNKWSVFLSSTAESGLFFDTLELYMGILKDRIETKEDGGDV